jgi:hypothetical protein
MIDYLRKHPYGLGIIYFIGSVLTLALHALFKYLELNYFAPETWYAEFLTEAFENLASEYHQVGIFIVLATYFIYKDSPQSRDGDDEMKKTLERIERKLKCKEEN